MSLPPMYMRDVFIARDSFARDSFARDSFARDSFARDFMHIGHDHRHRYDG